MTPVETECLQTLEADDLCRRLVSHYVDRVPVKPPDMSVFALNDGPAIWLHGQITALVRLRMRTLLARESRSEDAALVSNVVLALAARERERRSSDPDVT
jgi:hypothetical protein